MLDVDDIDRAVEYLRDSSEKAAQARADRLHLEDFSKSLKAKIMSEQVDEPLGAQERRAYSDPRYMAHLDALKIAIHDDEKFRFMREAAHVRVDVWRSKLSWEKTLESIR